MKINKNKSKILVLFDVGGALLELNYSGLYEAGARLTKTSPDEFKQKYINSKIESRVLSGEISNEEYLKGLRKLLNDNSLTEQQLAKIVRNCWGNQINETVDLKKKITESGYSVGIFSNANQFAIQILSKEFPEMFETYGGPKIYSYEVGDVKPNNPMYERIQKMCFDNVTYIDDNEHYVRKGLEFGWNGILFTPYIDSAEAIRAEKCHNDKKTNYKIKVADSIEELVSSLSYIGYFYYKTGDIMLKDSSLTGGTTITLIGDIDSKVLESSLKSQFSDLNLRKITDLKTGKAISTIIETSAKPEEIKPVLEKILDYKLTTENSSIEFTGPSLSKSFYKQLMIALLISFILMSFVIFILFRTFIPSIAVIFSIFSDIVMPLALVDFLGIEISAAGIAAFLMLIGYSVDTDILLTTRAIRKKGGTINTRLYGAFKTGIFMTSTALVAVIPAFFIVSALPDSFRQIFLILALGLFADIINTWLTNMSIIKWYCEKRRLE